MNRHLRIPEVRVSGAPDQEEPDDPPTALPPFALTLASIPRRRHSWICGHDSLVTFLMSLSEFNIIFRATLIQYPDY
ncbi:unnamed protein product [Leptosia nina]|uniref:Uncharacterized protein n=1 Tax=Leptosia nina TaxID=320188 RepID=A0AAV1JVM2_9NEOP